MSKKKPNRTLQRTYHRYPSLFPFGLDVTYLSAEEEATAPLEARLKSAWAYLVTVVVGAWKGYRDREKACVGLEDAMQDVVTALIERDSLFDPTRGRYTTFAKMIALQAVGARRRLARVVSAPVGPVGRIRKYKVRVQDGTLSDRGQRTLRCLQTVIDDQDSLIHESALQTDPDLVPNEVIHREEAELAAQEVVDSIQHVDPVGASVLARRWGLFRAASDQTANQIAGQIPGHGPRKIKAIEERATHALRDHLRARRQARAAAIPSFDAKGASPGPDDIRRLPGSSGVVPELSPARDSAADGHVPEPADWMASDADPAAGDRQPGHCGGGNR